MNEVSITNGDDVSLATSDSSVIVVLDDEIEVIQTLEQGPPGPQGPPGEYGEKGDPGNTILYGSTDPAPSLGVDGNFYINTATHFMFGPKWLGVWPAGTSLIGPQGPQGVKGDKGDQGIQGIQGPQGIQGVPGADGNTVLYGAADPVAGTGVNGNFYINTTTHFLFGPKAGGAWPAGTSLVGPQGPKGDTGAASTVPGPPVDTTYLVRTDAAQVFTETQAAQGRRNIYAAPFDALAFNGLQINGSFDVSQALATSGATAGFFCDQWQISIAGTSVVLGQQSAGGFVAGLPYYCAASVSTAEPALAAASFGVIIQNIEGMRTARLAWGTINAQPLTVAFWTMHHRPGTYSLTFRNASSDRVYCATYTQNAADTPELKVITVPGDTTGTWNTDTTTGITMMFALGCGTTYTAPAANAWQAGNYLSAPGQVNALGATTDRFRISGVMVLPGNEAPSAARHPRIMRLYDPEIRLCQRYYCKVAVTARVYGTGGGIYNWPVPFPCQMRAVPTVSWSGGSFVNNSGSTMGPTDPSGTSVNFSCATTGDLYVYGGSIIADARL
jgi:hypothetical protein